MAKLYFYYSSMNAGKSAMLLQINHNYMERGMRPLIFTSCHDDRSGEGVIVSRIGLSHEANIFKENTNLYEEVINLGRESIDCLLIDEAQFLTKDQVQQLSLIVDQLNISVMSFGLRTDFQGKLFEGSKFLLAIADNLKEIKNICHCGKKATMILRFDEQGLVITEGEQIVIGGEERYVSVCRKHFYEKCTGII
tara:strand:- start:16329 stop:16910 length:582 start_codon:yes stop_codon:yes gene_type:complete